MHLRRNRVRKIKDTNALMGENEDTVVSKDRRPYLQQKTELEAEEKRMYTLEAEERRKAELESQGRRTFELEAEERRYKLDGDK